MQKGPPEPYDVCRNCKHFDYQHSEWPGTEDKATVYPCLEVTVSKYDKENRTIEIVERCGCTNWEPLDNLKYLEMKAHAKDI